MFQKIDSPDAFADIHIVLPKTRPQSAFPKQVQFQDENAAAPKRLHLKMVKEKKIIRKSSWS
jgi:hypothetical protein